VPVNPYRLVTVTVIPFDWPVEVITRVGDADIAKSGDGFSKDIVVVWVLLPLVAVMVIVAGSGLGGLITEIVRAELPDPPVMVLVEKLVWIPDGVFAERLTVPVKPLIGDTVITDDADWPGVRVNEAGAALTVKS
jgi:hypothetical protein